MKEKSALAIRLKELRKEKHETAQQVADIIGIKSATYRRYEIDTEPKAEIYIALANHFGVSVDYLISGKILSEDSAPQKANRLSDGFVYRSGSEAVELSADEAELIRTVRMLSKKDFDEVLAYASWKKSNMMNM
ncbi:MAG: helix-turn-helix domain-containing protein [Clostridiales bacterium]|nr:helix-turn-helix domain-containing protein [Clostridiales bacterium]